MSMIRRMWLLVRFNPSTFNSGIFTYSHRVDIELGIQSSQSTPRSLEAPERDEVIASSAPSADQVGGVAESVAMPGSVQHPELQPTLPMTVDAEASLSSALVQGTPIDSNGLAGVDTENAQPALTDVECQELRPAANDHL